jgi:hypothetical protein
METQQPGIFVHTRDGALCETCARKRGVDLGDPRVEVWEVGSGGWTSEPGPCLDCGTAIDVELALPVAAPTTPVAGVSAPEADPTVNEATGKPCKGKAAARALAALVLAHHDADLPGVHLPHIFLAEAEEALSPFGWPNVDALRARLGLS